MLISVMILLAIFLIALAVGLPKVGESIQRDRELETMHRGKQYIRAIQLYYKKFHAYPPNLDALVKTSEIRFLRKKYIDPITGKDDWKPIRYCQNKTPMAMGFFGQPLAGSGCGALAGTGPGGIPGATTPGSGINSPSPGTVTNAGSSGGPVDANGTSIGSTGQTFGGGGIVGVEPASEKHSILIYKKKDHYNEWEFLYSPLSDQKQISIGNAGNIGQPIGGTGGQPIGGIGGQPVASPPPSPQPVDNNGPVPPALPPETTPQQ